MRVENQAPPLRDYNLVAGNRPLLDGLRREGAAWYEDELLAFGAELGGEPLEWGRLANEHPPRLRTYDRYGDRIDEVEFHPAWHALLELGVETAVHATAWRRCTGTSGSARRRCATRSSCSHRHPPGSRATCSRACFPTGRATRSTSSG